MWKVRKCCYLAWFCWGYEHSAQQGKSIQFFWGNVSVSIEGNRAHYPDPDSCSADKEESNTLFDLHGLLSDDNSWMACSVDAYANKLIEELKGKHILSDDRRALGSNDGRDKNANVTQLFVSWVVFPSSTILLLTEKHDFLDMTPAVCNDCYNFFVATYFVT